ncbi:ABC transporter ATP-binding protein [Clostridium algidicarnis]|uniref:ATP-binding cassette domain-containing protein n=1 Tax=Clostridium algidicarnis TaxID=37659 RepID=UPI001C0C6D1B|nr:ABC transporter ATP-binding protein [Clostridium algidicarnis]MBU3210591.1 ABC transporter ATP-binding protein [Clostridium algidicarnis]
MVVAIRCENLSKSYGKVEAVKSVNLALEEDKIYGLLGRNGAGKSTLANLIASQIIRDSGSINIFNEEVFENTKALENICLVKEKELPMEEMRVKKIFEIAGILYKSWDENYKEFLVKEFNLDVKKKYKNLSRGNKSIAQLIIGLSSRAKITIFDEPSLGLDAAVREKFYNILLKDYEENKRTIILSTHLIDEVSNLFEEVIIMNKGEVILKEEVTTLLEKAHFLRGREEIILPLIKDKELVYKDEFGATAIIGVIGVFKKEELKELKDKNVEISPIPLQKLFIYITEKLNG